MSATTIDKKVVEMRFDNEQFKRESSNTLKILEKLKTSLNMSKSAKAFEGLERTASKFDLSGISKGVEQLSKRFSTFGIAGMRIIENVTDAMTSKFGTAIKFVTNSVVSGGLKRSMNIENAHFQLQALLKDEKEVQRVMDDAMYSVDGTAYAYDEAAKAASQFAASGIKSGEQMREALTGITGVAAMTNSEYEGVARIFNTVAGNGRLMGDQLLQLSSRGMNAASTIADYLKQVEGQAGATEKSVREMVSSGQVSFELFSKAMNWAFGDSAFRANETFTGAFANMKSALARIGAGFFSPLIEQNSEVVKLFNALRLKINEVKTALVFDKSIGNVKALSKVFSDLVLKISKSLTEFVTRVDISPALSRVSVIVDKVFTKLDNLWENFTQIAKAFNDVVLHIPFKNAVDSVKSLLSSGKKIFKGLKSAKKTVDPIDKLADALMEIDQRKRGLQNVYDTAKKFFEEINKIKSTIKLLVTNIIPFGSVLDTIGGILKGILGFLKPIRTAFQDAFDPSNSGINFLSGALRELRGHLEDLINGFNNISSDTKKNIYDTFKGLFDIVSALAGVFVNFINAIFPATKAGESLGSSILGITGALGRNLSSIAEWITQSKSLKKFIDFLGGGVRLLIDGFKLLVKWMGKGIDVITELDAPKRILQGLFDILVDVGGALGNAFKIAYKNVKKFIGLIMEAFETMDFTELKEYFGNTFGAIVEMIATPIGKVADAIKKLIGAMDFGNALMAGGLITHIYTVKKLCEILEPITGIFKSVKGTIDAFKGTLLAYQKEIKAKALFEVSKAIALLGATLIALTFVDQEKLAISATVFGLFATGILVASSMLIEAKRKAHQIEDLPQLFGEIAKEFSLAFKNITKTFKMAAFGKLMKDVATSIIEVVISLLAITYAYNKDPKAVISSLAIVGALCLLLVSTVGALSVTNKKLQMKYKDILSMSTIIVSIGAALMLAVGALKKLMNMKLPGWQEMTTKMLILSTLMLEVGVLTGVLAKIEKKSGKIKLNSVLASMAGVYLAVLALDKLFKIDLPNNWGNKLFILSSIFASVIALIAVIGSVEKKGKGLTGSFIGIAGMMLASVFVIKQLADIPMSKLLKGVFAYWAIIGAVGKCIKEMNNVDGKSGMTAKALLGVVATMVSIGVVISFIGDMSWATILKGVISLSAVILSISSMFKSIGKMGDQNPLKALLPAVLMLGSIVAALYFTQDIPLAKMLVAVLGISVIFREIGKMFKALSNNNFKIYENVMKVMLAATGILVSVVVGLIGISALGKFSTILASMVAIDMIMTALVKIIGKMSEIEYNDNLKKTVTETIKLIVGVAGSLTLLSALGGGVGGWEGILAAVLAIKIIIDSLAKVIRNLSELKLDGDFLENAIFPIIMLMSGISSAITLLAALGGGVGGWESILASAAALSAVTFVLVEMFDKIAGYQIDKKQVKETLLTFGMFIIEMGLVGVGLGLLADIFNGDGMIKVALSMGIIILAIAAVIKMLPEGAQVGSAIKTAGAIGGFIDVLSVVVGAMAGIFGYIDSIGGTKYIEAGLDVMVLIAEGIGRFFGAIIAGVAQGVVAIIESVGTALSNFAINSKTFFEFVNENITSDTVANVGFLAGALLALTISELISGILNWVGSLANVDMASFGNTLSQFAEGAKGFFEATKNIKKSSMDAIDTLANAMLKLTASSFLDGIARLLGSKKSLKQFGDELVAFAEPLKKYVKKTKKITQEDVQGGVQAAVMIAGIYEYLPDVEGLLPKVFGKKKTLSDFAEELSALGEKLPKFVENVQGIDSSSVEGARNIALMFAALYEKLPDVDGWTQKIKGEKLTLTDFGTQMLAWAAHLPKFMEYTSGISENDCQGAIAIGEALASLAGSLSEYGGWGTWFTGDQMTLQEFGQNIESFGSSMLNFTNTVKDVDANAMNKAVNAFKYLVGLCQDIQDINSQKIYDWSTQMLTLSNDFAEQVKNQMSDAVDSFNELKEKFVETAKEVVYGIANGLADETAMGLIRSRAQALVGEITDKLKWKDIEEEFRAIGMKWATALKNSVIGKNKMNIWDAYGRMATGITDYITTLWNIQNNVSLVAELLGKYYVAGLVSGISKNQDAIIKAINNVAKGTNNKITTVWEIHSPSKVAERYGKFYVLGLEAGFKLAEPKVLDSVYKLGKNITKAMQSQISRINLVKMGKTIVENIKEPISKLNLSELLKTNVIDVLKNYAKKTDTMMKEFNRNYFVNDQTFWKAMYNDVVDYCEQTGQELITFEQFMENIFEKMTDIVEDYRQKVEDNTKSVFDQVGMFEQANWDDEAKTSDEMVLNTVVSAEQYKMFADLLAKAYDKIKDPTLLSYIKTLGVENYKTLESIMEMSDTQLEGISRYLEQRMNESRRIALMNMYNETEEAKKQLKELFGGIEIDFDKFIKDWDGSWETVGQILYDTYLSGNYDKTSRGGQILNSIFKDFNEVTSDNLKSIGETFVKNIEKYTKVASGVGSGSLDNMSLKMKDRLNLVNDSTKKQQKQFWEDMLLINKYGADQNKREALKSIDIEKYKQQVYENTKKVLDDYTSALKSNTDALFNQIGFFDEVAKQDAVSKDKLLENSRDKIEAQKEYHNTMEEFNKKLNGMKNTEGFEAYINSLGIESTETIKAINSMTKKEFQEYINNFNEQYELAEDESIRQMKYQTEKYNQALEEATGITGLEIQDIYKYLKGKLSFSTLTEYLFMEGYGTNDKLYKARKGLIDAQTLATLKKELPEKYYKEALEYAKKGVLTDKKIQKLYDKLEKSKQKTGKTVNNYYNGTTTELPGFEDIDGDGIPDIIGNQFNSFGGLFNENNKKDNLLSTIFSSMGLSSIDAIYSGFKDFLDENGTISKEKIIEWIEKQADDNAFIKKVEEATGLSWKKIAKKLGFKTKAQKEYDKYKELYSSKAQSVTQYKKEAYDEAYDIGETYVEGLEDPFVEAPNAIESSGIITMSDEALEKISKLLENIIKIIENDSENYKRNGKKLGKQFLNGIKSLYDEAKTVGQMLGNKVVSGLDGLATRMNSIGVNAGIGLVNGLNSKLSEVASVASDLAAAAANATAKRLVVESPSKVMKQIGDYAGLGFIQGIGQNVQDAYGAGIDMADSTINGFREALAYVNEYMQDEDVMKPTITPIIDLSNVQEASDDINRLFNEAIKMTNGEVLGISASIKESKKNNKNSNNNSIVNNYNTYDFNQNNYSPKALERIEIYRQTNNQFRQLKEAMNRA